MRLELLGTLGCHLCDQAESYVYQCAEAHPQLLGVCQLVKVDIAEDEALLADFALKIPVLRAETGELWCWPFPPVAELQAALVAAIQSNTIDSSAPVTQTRLSV